MNKAEVEAVLHRIRQFDPIGVGARNIGECLKCQLECLHPNTALHHKACELVTKHLELLAKRDYAALKRRLRLSSEKLQTVIQCIRQLNPRPGTKIGSRAPEYIVPDVFVNKRQGEWFVELNHQWTPALQINQHYAALINRTSASIQNNPCLARPAPLARRAIIFCGGHSEMEQRGADDDVPERNAIDSRSAG